jgi:Pyruvate/2-oxoacid:ferredoxin oxidoreductase delta subunit
MMTGAPGIFAGGDMTPGDQSVTIATGHGKKAARAIDAWLNGKTYVTPEKADIVGFEKLHLPVYSDADPRRQAELGAASRMGGFDEIISGLSALEAQFEAQRCYSCGDCYECDNCYAACPEEAIVKLGPGRRYEFDYDKCTGCATCYEQCPCHAIDMIPETTTNG